MNNRILIMAVVLLVISCTNQKNPSGDKTTDAPLHETYWQLTEMMGKAIQPQSGLRDIYMILTEENSRVHGFSGCNNFSGDYELKEANRLSFSQMISTKMACLNVMETETQFLNLLQQTDSYYLNRDTLQLIRARMAPLAKFRAKH